MTFDIHHVHTVMSFSCSTSNSHSVQHKGVFYIFYFCDSLSRIYFRLSNAGTLSVQDVLTDLGAEEVDLFLGGKADGKYGRAVATLPKSVVKLFGSA